VFGRAGENGFLPFDFILCSADRAGFSGKLLLERKINSWREKQIFEGMGL
jgi:hypothetical protein